MDRPVHPQLQEFLSAYASDVSAIALKARALVLGEAPLAVELIYDSYNALSIAFSSSERLRDAFCHVAVYRRHVNLGFNRGSELEDPEGILVGAGRRIRHVRIATLEELKQNAVRVLVQRAARMRGDMRERQDSSVAPAAIVKAVSPSKRRPNR